MILPDNARRMTESEWVMDCPTCGKEGHFYFNVNSRKGYCQVCHWGCGYKTFLKEFDLEDSEDRIFFVPEKLKLHSRRQLLGAVPAWTTVESRLYLKGRGVDETTARAAGLVWHKESGCLGATMTSVSRTYQPEHLIRRIRAGGKWRPLNQNVRLLEYGFGHPQLIPENKGVVIFEGIFDLLATRLLGHGLALCGSNMSRSWALYLSKKYTAACLWLDPDLAGRLGLKKAVRLLKGVGLDVYWVEGRDPKVLRPDKVSGDKKICEILTEFSRRGTISKHHLSEE